MGSFGEGLIFKMVSFIDMDKNDSSGLVQWLKVAEQRAAKSGRGKADVREVLERAEKEITVGSLKGLWQDAAEFRLIGDDKAFQAVFDRAQWRMSEAVGVEDRTIHAHIVGHALVRAAEGGYSQVLATLLKGLSELQCSVLTARFLGFAMLTASEAGSFEVVQELMRSTSLAMVALMGYEMSKGKSTESGYPFVRARLTTQWMRSVAKTKILLPPATHVLDGERLELRSAVNSMNHHHVEMDRATRFCYQIYCVWRFLIIAVCNGHGAVVQELLVTREQCLARSVESKRVMPMSEDQMERVVEIRALGEQIDERFAHLAMKIAGKLGRDIILYSLYNSTTTAADQTLSENSRDHQAGKLWRCASRSQFGVWEVFMDVPVLLMELETSYQNTKDLKQLMRPYRYIKPILPQLMQLNVQLKVMIDIQPNYIEMTVGVNHVRVTVENQMWKEKRTGHFPTFVSLAVTPVTPTMTSVSMTASSSNMATKVGVGEQVRVSVAATLKAAPTAGVGLQFAKSTMSKVDGKPWRMEQLPVAGDQGGQFNWSLSNLHGQSFDRLNPMLQRRKKSIWQFGKRVPANPLLVLPFGTNGGVNFTSTEFDDTLSWRFPKELENTDALFNIDGAVHTTYITQDTFWETRMVPFELRVEQKLEPCGDPMGTDKKKKKKKK